MIKNASSARRKHTRALGAVFVLTVASGAFGMAGAQATTVSSSSSGWVGVSLIQRGEGDNSHGLTMGYPVIASVEPGSPAQSAGLVAGDTIVAYNDLDARANPLAYQKLLKAGRHITIKVRRNGTRDIALTVGRRTARNAYRSGIVINSDVSSIPAGSLVGIGPIAISAPLAPGLDAPLAGAQLTRLNAGLASALNVASGVLVIDVGDGTPAMSAGLEAGDVIVKADSIAVSGPLEIVRAMRASNDKSVVLDVVRKGKSEKITLKW